MIKYLELDSSYRNRQRNPSQAMFEVYYDRTIEDVDPVSESAPTQSWQGNTASINGTVVSSTRDTIVFTSVGTPQDDPNYYVNTILSPPGTRILSYKYLGSNTAEVTVEDMQLALTTGTVITVSDPTDLALLRVFVPDTPIDLRNYYVGYYLYDETLNLYAKIVASESGVVTVDNAIPGWAVTDSFSIRSQLPATSGGTTGAASTLSTVTGVNGGAVGMFIRLIPSYPSVAPAGEIRQIVSYSSGSAGVYPPFSSSPASLPYELLRFSRSNQQPLVYNGTTVNDLANSTLRLLNLMVPNKTLSVGYGGKLSDYPYLYVRLTPKDTSNYSVIVSNNPHSNHALFRVTIDHDVTGYPFLKFTGDDANVRVKFKVDTDFTFQVTLPNGETVQFEESDTESPVPPNPLLQISCVFEVIRDC